MEEQVSTKRLRPQSPTSSPTTATSSVELFSSTTEGEEDMAKCLILLAQGNNECRRPADKPRPLGAGLENHNHCSYNEAAATTPKFASRRYLEAATSMESLASYYVYQCKTCGRTFPSFQALGGHRASHKRPRNTPNCHGNGRSGSFINPLSSPSQSSLEKEADIYAPDIFIGR
ncbi:hypothetical protein SAY87_027700 [Trapa incisa]|uniref:C2H2-type domain-containing protein n=1 Tax=Trapa incisa TaxID=236973 RepID=A0AAN7JMT9_9MYRT|nr:hypothetical protein SAY87_027700 [Trapa incisa]